MKITRILMALVATLIFASWCAAQCGPARPKGGSATGSIDDAIIAQEQLIIDAIKKRDANAFKSMVDMNGYEVNAQGSRTLSETVTELFSPDLSISEYKMESRWSRGWIRTAPSSLISPPPLGLTKVRPAAGRATTRPSTCGALENGSPSFINPRTWRSPARA